MNILILDDEPRFSDVLETSLKSEDNSFNITKVQFENEARTVVSGSKIDIVIVDYCLYSGTGLDFAKQMKRLYPSVIFILVSSEENIRRLVEADVIYAFFHKGSGKFRQEITKAVLKIRKAKR